MTVPGFEHLPRNSMGWYGIPLAGETYFLPAVVVAEIISLRGECDRRAMVSTQYKSQLAAVCAPGAGLKVVPREPTEAMVKAYYDALHGTHPTATMNPDKALVEHHIKAMKRWKAMWDAAP